MFAPLGASVDFAVCNVVKPLTEGTAAATKIASADCLIFSYVCHETSRAAAGASWPFYAALGRECKLGAVLVFADVLDRAAACFDEVHAAIARGLSTGADGGEGGTGRAVVRAALPPGIGRALHAELMVLHVTDRIV
jgi:hypothetical protein